ncbi:MAG: hypothetical protein OXC53_02010 [Rhodobacteraceae bacterium]|nr:hypothetical protein [Paracoccaceae bacterium]
MNIRRPGLLMVRNLTQTAVLRGAPFRGLPVKECPIDTTVEFIDVHGINPFPKTRAFGVQPTDGCLVFLLLFRMAGLQGQTRPVEHLVIKPQSAQHLGELIFKDFLAHMLPATGRRIACAFLGIARAVIIDVFLLLHLTDNGAPTSGTGDQPGKREVMFGTFRFPRRPAVQDGLDPLPQFDRNERDMLALISRPLPVKLTGVDAVTQNRMNSAHRHPVAAPAIDQAFGTRPGGDLPQRIVTRGIPVEQLGDQRGQLWIRRNHLPAIRTGHIAITDGRAGGPMALRRFLKLTLAGFFRQIVNIVLGHHDADPMHQLLCGPRVPRQNNTFLRKMDFHAQLIECHPVPQVAV